MDEAPSVDLEPGPACSVSVPAPHPRPLSRTDLWAPRFQEERRKGRLRELRSLS